MVTLVIISFIVVVYFVIGYFYVKSTMLNVDNNELYGEVFRFINGHLAYTTNRPVN